MDEIKIETRRRQDNRKSTSWLTVAVILFLLFNNSSTLRRFLFSIQQITASIVVTGVVDSDRSENVLLQGQFNYDMPAEYIRVWVQT